MKFKINKIGLAAASVHFLILIYLISNTSSNNEIWIWMIFSIIDFPVSELNIGGLNLLISFWGEPPFEIEWKTIVYRNWPAFLHLTLGSIWWYFIPVLLETFFNFIGGLLEKNNENKNT